MNRVDPEVTYTTYARVSGLQPRGYNQWRSYEHAASFAVRTGAGFPLHPMPIVAVTKSTRATLKTEGKRRLVVVRLGRWWATYKFGTFARFEP